MSKEQIRKQMKDLIDEIQYHNDLYYNKDKPKISDYDYDMLLKKLTELEQNYPDLKFPNSPVSKVGGEASSSFEKVEHKVQMGSLQDAFDFNELFLFDKRVREKIADVSYVVEPKVDGLSVSLEYENGKFVRGSTRGDGFVGEDVTENIRMISTIPSKLNSSIPYIEVRAEVFLPISQFIKLVSRQENLEEIPFKNPRNAAAGTLRQKKASVVASRGLSAVCFNIQQIEGISLNTHSESIELLRKLGFNVIQESRVFENIDQCIDEINQISKSRSSYPFDIDGAVIKVNSLSIREILGSNAKNPRWAIAFKYPPEEKETTLKEIQINIGRTGALTPVAIFDPIELSGTTVSRASLHNQDFINEKDIRLFDTILVRKAGEIIPEIVGSKKHNKESKIFKIPNNCPVCGSVVVRNEGEAAIRCENPSCPATRRRNLIHFASRDAMDIAGLGEANINALLNANLICNIADLYTLKKDDILNLDRFAEKSANNLISAIEKSKSNPLWRLIFGLGIRGVGQSIAKLICNNYSDIFQLMDATKEELSTIEGIGHILSSNIENYFSLDETKEIVHKLSSLGLNMKSPVNENKKDSLLNLTFVITGKLKNKKRDEMKQLIENYGGKVSSSVSSKTNYLIVGEDAGSKLDKAISLGIEIIDEKKALDMIADFK